MAMTQRRKTPGDSGAISGRRLGSSRVVWLAALTAAWTLASIAISAEPRDEASEARAAALYADLETNPDVNACVQIALELAKLGAVAAPRAVQALAIAKDPVAPYAADILKELGPEATPALADFIGTTTDSRGLDDVLPHVLEFRLEPTVLVPALRAALRNCSSCDRQKVAHVFSMMGDSCVPALPDIVPLLDDKDSKTASWTARAVGNCGEAAEPYIPKLIALASASSPVREAAIFALGSLGSRAHEALPLIKERLSDVDGRVRIFAARALATVGPPDAETLTSVLSAARDRGQDFAYGSTLNSDVAQLLTASTSPGNPAAAAVVEKVIRILDGDDADARAMLLGALSDSKAHVRSIEGTLLRLLQRSKWNDRRTIEEALCQSLGKRDCVSYLLSELDKLDWQKDAPSCAATLSALDSAAPLPCEALPAVERQLRRAFEMNITEIWGAAHALATSGTEGLRVLIALLPDWKEDRDNALCGVKEILDTSGPEVAPLLLEAVKNEITNSGRTGRALSLATRLSLLNPPHLTELAGLLELPDAHVRRKTLTALADANVDVTAMLPRVTQLLTDADPRVRTEAARVMSVGGPNVRDAAEALTAALNDTDPKVQLFAALAMAQSGACVSGTIAALASILNGKDTEDQPRIPAALSALKRLAPEHSEAADALLQALEHSQPEIRHAAANCLVEDSIAIDKALPLVMENLVAKNRQIQTDAAKALTKAACAPAVQNALPMLRETIANVEDRDARDAMEEAVKAIELGDLRTEIIPTEIPSERLGYRHYEYALRVNGANPIKLARLYKLDKSIPVGSRYVESYGCDLWGFDEKSMEFCWLEKGRLLRVMWSTVPQGNGINTIATDLLLLKTATGWRDIYRNCMDNAYHGGASDGMSVYSKFTYTPATGSLLARVIEWHMNPDERGGLHAENTTATEYCYHLENEELKYVNGEKYLDIRDEKFDIHHVAEFLSGESGQTEAKIKELRELNPSLQQSDACTGKILVKKNLPAPSLYPESRYQAGL